MKTKISLLLLSVFVLGIHAQECKRALWAKAFATASSSNAIIDGGRRSDSTFTICGKFGNTDLMLGTIAVPYTGVNNWFLANHDSAGVFSKAQQIAWCNSSPDALTINKIDIGKDNSVYITGYWKGSTVHIGDKLLPTTTVNKMFVAKFDASLNFQWMRMNDWMGSDCYALDVASDKDKNVYVVGYFSDDAFKMGDAVVTKYSNIYSSTEGFFLKFDSLGTVKFLKNIGSYYDDYARVVVTDSIGDVYVMGTTGNSTAHVFHFDDKIAVKGGVIYQTMFIGKYSGTDGHCIWGKMAGGYQNTSSNMLCPYDACLGDNNSIIFCGQMGGQVNLYPKSYTSGQTCGFVSKMDADGNNLWLKTASRVNSSTYTPANVRAVSYYNGDIAIAGTFFGDSRGYVDDFPVHSLSTGTTFVGFNAMFTTTGQLKWARSTSGSVTTDCALIDNSGNQIIWGVFKGTISWYPLSLTNSATTYQLYMLKYVPYAGNPALTVNAGPDKITTCGTSVQLNGSVTPTTGVSYGWFPNADMTKTPSVNPGSNTSYYLYSAYQGCVKRDTVNVTYSNDTIKINAGPDKSMCVGDSVQLITTCNVPTATYSWSAYSYINTYTSANPYVKPPLSTIYTVTATANGCKATDTVAVFVRDNPYIALPPFSADMGYKRTMMCSGSSLDLNLGDPLNTYTIKPLSMVTNVNNNLATLPAGNGQLVINATNQYGCSTKDSTLVRTLANLPAPPIVGKVADRIACDGDSLNFEIMYFTDSKVGYNFQFGWKSGWQIDSIDGKGWRDINIYDKHFNVFPYSYGDPSSTYYNRLRIYTVNSDMDGYKLRAWISDYCSPRTYSNAATLSIGPKITTQLINKTFCEGVTDSISVNSSSSSITYQWEIKKGGVFVPLVDKPDTIVANGRFLKLIKASTDLDKIEVRCKLEGCNPKHVVYSNTALLSVIPKITVLSQSWSKDTLCYLENGYLTVKVDRPELYSYSWYKGSNQIGAESSHFKGTYNDTLSFIGVTYSDTLDTYKCYISNSTCWMLDAYTTPQKLHIKPSPNVSWGSSFEVLCSSKIPLTLSGGLPEGGIYSGNNVISNIFSPPKNEFYTLFYTYTNEYNCSAKAVKYYNVVTCTDITENNNGDLTIANSNKHIIFKNASFFENNFSVSVFDISGKCVYLNDFSSNTKTAVLNDNPLPEGVYLIRFSDGKKNKEFKILID